MGVSSYPSLESLTYLKLKNACTLTSSIVSLVLQQPVGHPLLLHYIQPQILKRLKLQRHTNVAGGPYKFLKVTAK